MGLINVDTHAFPRRMDVQQMVADAEKFLSPPRRVPPPAMAFPFTVDVVVV